MPDVTPDPIPFPTEPPHAVEVHDAQAALDGHRVVGRTTPPAAEDAATEREFLRALVAVHGIDGVRKMIDSLN